VSLEEVALDPVLSLVIPQNRPKQLKLQREYKSHFIGKKTLEQLDSKDPSHILSIATMDKRLQAIKKELEKLQKAGARYYESDSHAVAPLAESSVAGSVTAFELDPALALPYEDMGDGELVEAAKKVEGYGEDSILALTDMKGKGKQRQYQREYAMLVCIAESQRRQLRPEDPAMQTIHDIKARLVQIQKSMAMLQKVGQRYHMKKKASLDVVPIENYDPVPVATLVVKKVKLKDGSVAPAETLDEATDLGSA
ncbi:hypothetical protein HDU91_000209, partial [Kappamyces sp. JEL0680]